MIFNYQDVKVIPYTQTIILLFPYIRLTNNTHVKHGRRSTVNVSALSLSPDDVI